jgi:hypothetical protein
MSKEKFGRMTKFSRVQDLAIFQRRFLWFHICLDLSFVSFVSFCS